MVFYINKPSCFMKIQIPSIKYLKVKFLCTLLGLLSFFFAANAQTHIGSLTDNASGPSLLDTRSVFVSGNYAYVASHGSNALEIVDITNPAAPVHKSKIVDGAGGALLNYPNSVYVSGNYAYVASTGSNALEIVDITNPAIPVHKGSASLVDINGGQGPQSVYVFGNKAYVACYTSQSLEI